VRIENGDPMTRGIYKELIKASEGPNDVLTRSRIAFCILTVTGIRINELLPLKVHQLQKLLESHWIGIDRSKRGPSNHKAFLTQEGKKIVEDRKKDFEFVRQAVGHRNIESTSSYVANLSDKERQQRILQI